MNNYHQSPLSHLYTLLQMLVFKDTRDESRDNWQRGRNNLHTSKGTGFTQIS